MIYEMLIRPRWLMALLRHGYPRFATMAQYAGATGNKFGTNKVIKFAREEMGGAFLWDEVARYRDRWKGPDDHQGYPASCRCRESGVARYRGHLDLEPRRPPD